MISILQIREEIRDLELDGRALCIHASMRSFGDRVENGAAGLLEAFLKTGCTVMTPAFSYGFLAGPVMPYMPQRNGAGNYEWYREHPLDPSIFSTDSKEISVEDMGVFARQVLLHPDAVRGNHPLNSFAAVGKTARALISGQDWQQVYAPYERLCAAEGLVLMAGTDLTSATILHYAEMMAGRTPFVRWAKDASGRTKPAFVGGCSLGFEHFVSVLQSAEKRITVGKSLWRLYPADKMAEAAAEAIRRDPMITHCGRENCRRCHDAVLGGPVLPVRFRK